MMMRLLTLCLMFQVVHERPCWALPTDVVKYQKDRLLTNEMACVFSILRASRNLTAHYLVSSTQYCAAAVLLLLTYKIGACSSCSENL